MTDEPVRPDPADTVPPGERADLADTARRLVKSNTVLAETVDALTARIKRSERRTFILAGSLALDVLLTVVVTVIGFRVDAASDCQAAQNDAFRYASVVGREATNVAYDQQLHQLDQQLILLGKLSDPAATSEARAAAGLEYVNSVTALKVAILEVKAKRSVTPLPTGNCS